MNIDKQFEPISTKIHYGEGNEFDKNSLKAYKYENELKRAVHQQANKLRYYLFNKHKIPFSFEVKISEPGETPITEHFSIIELINDKLTSCNTTVCLNTYEIYREKGIEEAISSLHKTSPLIVI